MLTTVDNPFNPFTKFDEWFAFDLNHENSATKLLGRIVVYSDELSETDQNFAIESAIDEIIREDPLLIYKKVTNNKEVSAFA